MCAYHLNIYVLCHFEGGIWHDDLPYSCHYWRLLCQSYQKLCYTKRILWWKLLSVQSRILPS